MIKQQLNKGFTLIEVLVALAVLAIAAAALLNRSSQSIQQSAYLEQKTLAYWIAENRINELRLEQQENRKQASSNGEQAQSEARFVANGRQSQEIKMAQREWLVVTDITQANNNPNVKRVEVSVQLIQDSKEQDFNLATVSGFIGRY